MACSMPEMPDASCQQHNPILFTAVSSILVSQTATRMHDDCHASLTGHLD